VLEVALVTPFSVRSLYASNVRVRLFSKVRSTPIFFFVMISGSRKGFATCPSFTLWPPRNPNPPVVNVTLSRYTYRPTPRSLPALPHEPRNLRNVSVELFFKNDSLEATHPAETAGKAVNRF